MHGAGRSVRMLFIMVFGLALVAGPRIVLGFFPAPDATPIPAADGSKPAQLPPLPNTIRPEPTSPFTLRVQPINTVPSEPARIGLTLETEPEQPKSATKPGPAPEPSPAAEMPDAVADAVKMLLNKTPAAPKELPAPKEPQKPVRAVELPVSSAPTPAAVAPRKSTEPPHSLSGALGNAFDALFGRSKSVLATSPDQDLPRDKDDDAKIAEVARSITALNESIVGPGPQTLDPLVVPTAASISQEPARSAVKKAAAELLGQIPEAPTQAPSILNVSVPSIAPGSTCATCGRNGGLGRPRHGHADSGRCATCGGGWRCSPGHAPCEPCEAHDGPFGRLFCDFYECLCCPDPCYDPQWRQVPNAALFVDGARPVTQTEVRWSAGRSGSLPDRAEYLWARADGMGRGPRPPAGRLAEYHFDYDDLTLITETATDKLSAIVEMPYRAVSPDYYAHGAGFGDIGIGTKTLLFDCELLQVSMMMKTYLPVGNSLKGVGPGHVTIEPSLLYALKIHKDTYLQGQFAEWIPIGGDPVYAGSVFRTSTSLNHVVHRFGPDIPLVGTLECITYSFQDGAYTDPISGSFQKASGTTYVSVGPGLRLMFCDKLDIGFGCVFSLTEDNFARQYYRTSVRFRF